MFERLIYRSLALSPDPAVAMDDILKVSVAKNARLDLTGALGFTDRHYIQLLEGPVASLDRLMATLMTDPRHKEISILYRAKTAGRVLPGWSMARLDLSRHAPRAARLVAEGDGLALTTLLVNVVARGETAVA